MRRAPHGPRCDLPRSESPGPLALRRRLAEQDGVALILAVLVLGILTIATASTITVVTSNEHAYGRDRQANRALNIAEAGLNGAVAALKASPASTATLTPANGTLDHGTWSYTGTRVVDPTNPDLYYWTVTSTGTSPNGLVSRIIQTQVSQTITHTSTSTTTTTPASAAYKYGFFLGDPASDCVTLGGGNSFAGNGTLNVDVFVRGSLCLQGNGAILQPTGTTGTLNLYVGKKFKYSGNPPTVGTSAAKIKSAIIVGGCYKNNSAVTCSSSANSHIFANTYSSTQADVPKPTIDTAWYTNARPGPTTGCNNDPTNPANVSTYPSGYTATTFKNALFDGDGTRNTSVGTVDLLAFGNFDCRYYGSNGTLLGRIAWTNGSPGTLTVYGTVFIDANLTATGTEYAVYSGRGNLYVNGTVSFAGQAKICATPISGTPCLGNYAPSQNLLELVSVNAGNAPSAFSLTGQETFEGVAFMNGVFTEAGNGAIHGAVIADTASVSGNGAYPSQIDPPPGAPGAAATTTTTTSGPDQVSWSGVPGSWQQLR
jgi:Tfp pilus assembly protein PilX